MTRVLINAPETARYGETIEIKTMIAHSMETGRRTDAKGATIPRNIINRFECRYNGEQVFAADLFPAIAANPFIAFNTIAKKTGTISFAWTNDQGGTETASVEITVT